MMQRATEALTAGTIAALLGLGAGKVTGFESVTIAAAISAGFSGAIGGYRQVYAWRTVAGWYAFISDSTWGLIGTSLGNVLNLVNIACRNSGFRSDFSRRRNRHVYEGGAALQRGFAFTLGSVISNADTRSQRPIEGRLDLIDLHEDLHIWQNRWFGPVHQAIYVAWGIGGAVVAFTVWAIRRPRRPLLGLVRTAAYYDNPFEYWAYKTQGHWENNSADPTLKWG